MKKVLSLVLVLCIILAIVPVLAEDDMIKNSEATIQLENEKIDKSKHDEELKSYDEDNVFGIVESWKTPYGTIIHTGTKGVMHGSFNNLSLIRWDGTYLLITKNAPQMNAWTNAPWNEFRLSEDGKIVKVIYHGKEDNFVIEANLETGEVVSSRGAIEFTYTVDKENHRVSIEKYTGNSKKVIIPDEIEGMPVEIINTGAFYDCDDLEEIVISKNVFKISNQAFAHCENIKAITFLNPYTYVAEGGYRYVYSKNAPPYVPHGFKMPDFPGIYDCKVETVYGYKGSTAEKRYGEFGFKALEGEGKPGREYASIEEMATFIQGTSSVIVNGKGSITRKNVVLTMTDNAKVAEISYLNNDAVKEFPLEKTQGPSSLYIKDVLRAFELIEDSEIACDEVVTPTAENVKILSENSVQELLDEIETLAKNEGFSIFREGEDIIVINGKNSLGISQGKVTYRKDGQLIVEDLFVDGNLKYPADAIETVFGSKQTKSEEESPFILEETEDKVVIIGLRERTEEIVIPGEINGKRVEIGEGAFRATLVKRVVLDESIKVIPEIAFFHCTELEEINLENVEELGYCAFGKCKKLKNINLLNVKKWNGITENDLNEEGTRVEFTYNERLFRYNVYVPKSVFSDSEIETLRIKWPEVNFDEGAKTLPSLFLNCKAGKVVFENFTISPSLAEFKTLGQFAANPRWQSGVDLIQKNADLTIYCTDERAREYAEKIGVKFELIVPFEYTVNDGYVSIDKYTGTGGKVVIPDEIDGLPVTKINTGAFSKNENITQLIIPESVEKIDHMAVVECVNLESIVILNPYVYIASVDHGEVYEPGRIPYTPHGVMLKFPAFMSNGGVVYGYRNSTTEEAFYSPIPLEEERPREVKMMEADEFAISIEAFTLSGVNSSKLRIVKDNLVLNMKAGEKEVIKTSYTSSEELGRVTLENAVELRDGKFYVPVEDTLRALVLLGKEFWYETPGRVSTEFLNEKLGIKFYLGKEGNTITAKRGETTVQLTDGESKVLVNGEEAVWSDEVRIENDNWYLPIEDVLTAFSLKLKFNHDTNEVEVIEE